MTNRLINRVSSRAGPAKWGLVGGMFFLLSVSLLMPLPLEGRTAAAGADLLHAPTFAVVTWVANRVLLGPAGSFRSRILLGGVVLGIATLLEVCQAWFGRDGSVRDGWANALGILAGTLVALPKRPSAKARSAWIPRGVAVLCLAAASFGPLLTILDWVEQRSTFPLLASFETRRELTRWSEFHSRMARSREHVTHGNWGLAATWLPARYPAVILRDPPADWSGYQTLAMDLYVEPGPETTVTITVADGKHNRDPKDRYHLNFRTSGGTIPIRIPLAEVAKGPRSRELDLTDIAWLGVGADPVTAPRRMGLDYVRLEGVE
jgi:hypothetical protein